ncbi:MAG: molybdenum ABC transporter ATP-binding protein [Proteobacteria bacterium]|nr:MAG: molybdenum ABC transporter ATP-binding protein [Pseudomonadota bacterium]
MIELDFKKALNGIDLDVNLNIKKKSFVALSGESGAGKTTLLRLLSGLERGEGRLIVDGEVWQDENTFLLPQKRKIGFVFQDYALFPNMNILQNLLFIKKDIKKANHLLEISALSAFKHHYPRELSGGQKQRVALCRALMNEPKILLLDEPLSALDFKMRQKLQDEILNLHIEFNTTTIMVSHEISEIYKLADEIVLLKNGKVQKKGKIDEVLLTTKGSQKFSISGKVLEIKKVDVIYVLIIAIGWQITQIVINEEEAKMLKRGDRVSISTKAFAPMVTKLG